LAEVGQSDVLVVIVGHLYGSMVPERNISFTEAEYSEAHRLGKPCLVYLRDENVPILPKYMERDPEKIHLLDQFKETLRAQHVIDTFANAEDLVSKGRDALRRIVRELAGALRTRNESLLLLKRGADAWNAWRGKGRIEGLSDAAGKKSHAIDLSEASLSRAQLGTVNLSGVRLASANLSEADLHDADLRGADLSGAQLIGTNLKNARLTNANLFEANLTRANLDSVDLAGANLVFTRLLETNLKNAKLEDCYVYGISAWNTNLENTIQSGLVISPSYEPVIAVSAHFSAAQQ
jgi:hypothetical protein